MFQRYGDKKIARGPHGAVHQEWAYTHDAVVWVEDKPAKPNIIPFAGEMARWLQQKIDALPLKTQPLYGAAGELSNPYSYSLSTISLVICSSINDAVEFSESTGPIGSVDAEITRIRLESELTLYAARFCEAAIKQMLFCTQVPARMYKKSPLGKLLSLECSECKKVGKPAHDISLLGSLAHGFFLCGAIGSCATDHLLLAARRRNQEASHSDSQYIHPIRLPLVSPSP